MALELKRIQKRFGGAWALRRGDLLVSAGEVHLLLGENGAGKSTLMKIAAGMLRADGGEMRWKGRSVVFRSPAEAQRAGIAMVHQESLLAPHLSVAENIFLGREPVRWSCVVDRARALREARELIERHGFPLQAEWRVGRLSPAGKQLVEICRAIAMNAQLLIFDEPTSALSENETAAVFRIVRELRTRGASVIYITHRMEELREIGDRATILRDGETVRSAAMAELTRQEIVRCMVGREMGTTRVKASRPVGEVLLRVKGLRRKGKFEDVTFELRSGEIVGLAGLVGAGRTELCEAIFGASPADGGEVEVGGSKGRPNAARDAILRGMALAPEDRQRNGLAGSLPVARNIMMSALNRVSWWGLVNGVRERQIAGDLSGRLRLKTSSLMQQTRQLSGGNQQKTVIAKWVARGASVFLFDEPTRGIDVGAKEEVFALIHELASEGAAVLMVSSELPELLEHADRILVMYRGRVTAELPAGSTQEAVLQHALWGRT
jgi:ABC-type sugar transport system ATPase subunit